MVDRPEAAVAFLVAQLIVVPAQTEYRRTILVQQFGGQVSVGGHRAVVHDVGEKQQCVIFLVHADDLATNHLHPFVEDLLEIVRRDLRADDVAGFDRRFYRADEFVFMRGDLERDEMRADVGRDFIQRFLGILAGRLAPFHSLPGQERQHVGAFHQCRFFGINHRQKRRHGFTFVQRILNVMQQLREHRIAGIFARVLGLKPDFIGANIDQAFGIAFQPERLDISIFNVFFAAGLL